MARTLGPGKDKFRKFVSRVTPTVKELPLTHITDGLRLREIVEAGQIEPINCEILGEPLLYFFYGRPAYRPNGKHEPSSLQSYAPACFVLPPGTVKIKRAFPFDSGAFEAGRFNDFRHHRMVLEDFHLEPDRKAPQQLITLFYGSLERYFENKPIAEMEIPASEFEVEAYHVMARAEGNKNFDDRATTIEIQTSDSIALTSKVSAVIMPSNFMKDQSIIEPLEKCGASIIPYEYVRQMRPSEYPSLFYDKIRRHYVERGFLNETA